MEVEPESTKRVSDITIWLAPRADKMKRILCSDWLPELQDGPILPARDFPLCSRKSEIRWCNLFDHIINRLLTKLIRSRWLDIGLVLLCFYGPRRSQAKNLANI